MLQSYDVIVEFYSTKHGGRKDLPDLSSGQYRPHIVINADESETYLGIKFTNGPDSYTHDEEVRLTMTSLYENVDYSGLKRGVSFLIKEGSNTVGEGVVL